jgi:hypothetical protein
MYPTLEWRIHLTIFGAVAFVAGFALMLAVLIVQWRRSPGLPALLPVFGLLAIMLGQGAFAIVRLIGLLQGTDTLLLALAFQLGGGLVGLALAVAALVLRRRNRATG